jgi:hypothetical protein
MFWNDQEGRGPGTDYCMSLSETPQLVYPTEGRRCLKITEPGITDARRIGSATYSNHPQQRL